MNGRTTVPAPLLVLASITSVQFGSAVARTLFDDVGAAGLPALRLAIAALLLWVVVRPNVRSCTSAWERARSPRWCW